MNFKQLNTFREVMITGSMSEAARNLNRTQPAVSAQIASLEDEVGLKLFERREGRLHPVPEAHYLHAEASTILERLSATEQTLRGVQNLEHGDIRIVSMPGPSVFWLPNIVSTFVTDRTAVNVSLISRSSYQVQQLLATQRFDIGIADRGISDAAQSALVQHEMVVLPCVCAVPRGDPLAEHTTVTVQDLDGRPMATLYDDHPTCIQTRKSFQDQGASFNRRFDAQYFIPLLTFVEAGLAYAIVDPITAASYRSYRGDNATLAFLPFLPEIDLNVSVVTPAHRPLSKLATTFVNFLRLELQALT